MATNLVSSAIVYNVLTKYNYANWSTCLRSYLLGQDLWDVIETDYTEARNDPEFQTWKKKNYMALHAIQVSCGPEILARMRTIPSAKRAWDFLADMHKNPLQEVNEPGSSSRDKKGKSREIESSSRDPGSPSSDPGGENNDYLLYIDLLKAVESGDCIAVRGFLDRHPDAVTAKITCSGKRALHVATIAGHVDVVGLLLDRMGSVEALAKRDVEGDTALSASASNGITEIASLMVQRYNPLTSIIGRNRTIPLINASRRGHIDLTRYLHGATPSDSISINVGATLLTHCIVAKIFDIALELLHQQAEFAFASNDAGISPLYVLSQMTSAFPCGNRGWIYSCIRVPSVFPINNGPQNLTNRGNMIPVRLRGLVSNLFGIKQIYNQKLIHVQALEILGCICSQIPLLNEKQLAEGLVQASIFQAVKFGIVEIVVEIINSNPDLLWSTDLYSGDIFFFAIEYRQEKIFNLLYGLGARKEVISSRRDDLNGNMLHLAGMLGPASRLARISGAALQMQRELQWFKEVEQIVQPSYREARNADGKTPWELFTESHKDLVEEGKNWMKGTATSCTVVAALIVTIMFAAAITVPGGNIQETGTPIFFGNNWYNVFVISDVISFFSSSTSVLTFLGILTSRFAEDDFLKSLPRKMIIGLSSLFISIASMMIAFSATLFIMLDGRSKGLGYLVISLASVPVVLFILLQFPLLVEIFKSTYGPSIFDRKTKSWIGQKRVGSVRRSFKSLWIKCLLKCWIGRISEELDQIGEESVRSA